MLALQARRIPQGSGGPRARGGEPVDLPRRSRFDLELPLLTSQSVVPQVVSFVVLCAASIAIPSVRECDRHAAFLPLLPDGVTDRAVVPQLAAECEGFAATAAEPGPILGLGLLAFVEMRVLQPIVFLFGLLVFFLFLLLLLLPFFLLVLIHLLLCFGSRCRALSAMLPQFRLRVEQVFALRALVVVAACYQLFTQTLRTLAPKADWLLSEDHFVRPAQAPHLHGELLVQALAVQLVLQNLPVHRPSPAWPFSVHLLILIVQLQDVNLE
mmetsp:Transcript_57437/g.148258  ORF Transcript_57437/g.148258 Transcript_57437/m.148258 type:complete len:269 (-) Transcript_57437:110-916(-)